MQQYLLRWNHLNLNVTLCIFYFTSSFINIYLPFFCLSWKFQDIAIMDSLQVALENVVIAVFDGSSEIAGGSSEVHFALCRIFEGFLLNFSCIVFNFYHYSTLKTCDFFYLKKVYFSSCSH